MHLIKAESTVIHTLPMILIMDVQVEDLLYAGSPKESENHSAELYSMDL